MKTEMRGTMKCMMGSKPAAPEAEQEMEEAPKEETPKAEPHKH